MQKIGLKAQRDDPQKILKHTTVDTLKSQVFARCSLEVSWLVKIPLVAEHQLILATRSEMMKMFDEGYICSAADEEIPLSIK